MSSQLTPNKRPHDVETDSDPNPKAKLLKITQEGIVFRVLCPANKIENVIGKENNQIPGAKVNVEETLPGCNDRVIVIANEEKEKEVKENEDTNDVEKPEPIDSSSVQKALMLVFEKMVEFNEDNNNEDTTFALKLLLPSSQVGPFLGKSGSVIKQIASETGAQIRVLPRDKLPAFASSSDEVVQVYAQFLFKQIKLKPSFIIYFIYLFCDRFLEK